ncbi:MAG: 50S ribosomal protein L25 [Candidatus Omnitrophica bacterium]|nr:50S ribosomal protein L25 [Candidatus Omnitrophota bacterium]
MEKIKLNATMRTDLGKSGSKQLRKRGLVPAIVYRGGKQGRSVQIGNKELWKALHTEAGGNAIITLDILSDEKHVKKTVIVQEIQVDPVNEKVVHVDFHEISLKEKLKVNVSVNVKGEAVGVKEQEGVLTQVLWKIEVECLPQNLPHEIEVDLSKLENIDDTIFVKNLSVGKGVEVLDNPEESIVVAVPPTAEEIEPVVSEAEAVAAVEATEEKPEDEAEDKTTDTEPPEK